MQTKYLKFSCGNLYFNIESQNNQIGCIKRLKNYIKSLFNSTKVKHKNSFHELLYFLQQNKFNKSKELPVNNNKTTLIEQAVKSILFNILKTLFLKEDLLQGDKIAINNYIKNTISKTPLFNDNELRNNTLHKINPTTFEPFDEIINNIMKSLKNKFLSNGSDQYFSNVIWIFSNIEREINELKKQEKSLKPPKQEKTEIIQKINEYFL